MNKKQKPKRKKSITLHPRGRTWRGASFASKHAQDVTGTTSLAATGGFISSPDSRVITNRTPSQNCGKNLTCAINAMRQEFEAEIVETPGLNRLILRLMSNLGIYATDNSQNSGTMIA